ncbi:hypothetical protein WS9_014130 [Paraclostridium sordellii 8483]|uniref:hypothetical protein n=1 Tax=Paraclostridium sordellii TaxID=1505 RepID=UPI00030B3391|nr:hypothetical protein [Paeniclostridium sordellii]TAN64459.1 hypothetical protein WS9_014130 [Paeniclostridium sordellii 8483]CEK36523.1 hypothetical protein UMC2_33931 [[Clostridium] sordellii] [Paeniclostridium sordellii]
MAIDKELKNEVFQTMDLLGIDPDTWLSEQYSKFLEDNKTNRKKAIDNILKENRELKSRLDKFENNQIENQNLSSNNFVK